MVVKTRGFTLIETIIVIVIMAIAITGVTASLFPLGKQSADRAATVKATELGRAVMDEILGRNFDQKSGPNGGLPNCIPKLINDAESCTLPRSLGPDDGENFSDKSAFNDVDDFNGLTGLVTDVLDEDLQGLNPGYTDYRINIDVFYEVDNSGTMLGQASLTATPYKRINIIITDRQGQEYPISAIRGNF
ncbi:prepilin-type N-terminal cleavage/methylation domain-containing protein [Vibrio splendidus]